jgi:hypothetical protein
MWRRTDGEWDGVRPLTASAHLPLDQSGEAAVDGGGPAGLAPDLRAST